MLQSNDTKIINIQTEFWNSTTVFSWIASGQTKFSGHLQVGKLLQGSKISCTDFYNLLEKREFIQESILIKEMRYSEFVMKMNPNCFAAIGKRIDYCNIREVENTKFYCLKLVIQRRGQSAKICHRHYTLLRSTRFFTDVIELWKSRRNLNRSLSRLSLRLQNTFQKCTLNNLSILRLVQKV